MGWRGPLASALLLMAVSACYQEPVAIATFPPQASGTPSAVPPSPEPTRTARATPGAEDSPPQPSEPSKASPTSLPTTTDTSVSPTLAAGSPTAGCVDGWTAPALGSASYEAGVSILSGHLGAESAWTVDEMRYFTGPELPNVEPQYPIVERWYIRGALADEPNFRGRFLVERRTEQIAGISAVAPYASSGYASPDWTGFVGEGPPTTYLGLPGQWSGIPYDFVTGAGDGGFPGLPGEVADCLAGS